MITKEELLPFKDKHISVGVPNFYIYDKTFFYYGTLLEVTETEIKLQTKKGYKIVPISSITSFHEEG